MIRVITTRRLQQLELRLAVTQAELTKMSYALAQERSEKTLIAQMRDHCKAEAAAWERRATRLIDQIGVSSGTLGGPAMGEPAAPPPNPMRQVMRALNTPALPAHRADAAPAAPHLLGVDEGAARAALAAIAED